MLRERFLQFMWSQFGNPSGPFGRLIGDRMARGNLYDARWTVSLLDIRPESRVLEIGGGPGVSTGLAAEKASSGFVAGIDHSETMVQAARRRNANAIRAGRLEIRQGDAAALPYPDESFDRAFSIHSIYFWPRPADCLKELRRALKPGGLLAITIQPKDRWSEMQQRESDLRTLYSGPQLLKMFTDAGFRNVRLEESPEPDKFPGVCVLGLK